MDTISLIVNGMTCSACVKHVEKAIQSSAGVEKVNVNLKTGLVMIEGKIFHQVNAIVAALEEEGYPATVSTDLSLKSKEKSRSCNSDTGCCCH